MEACFFVHLLLKPPVSHFAGGVLYEQNRPHLSMMCQMGGHFILYYGTCDAYHQWQMDRVAPWVPVRFRVCRLAKQTNRGDNTWPERQMQELNRRGLCT